MSETNKPRQFYIVESENYNKPPYLDSHRAYHCKQDMYENIHVIELEPTLQLIKEMGEALRNIPDDEIIDNRDYFISGNANEALEKYRKFLEGIK